MNNRELKFRVWDGIDYMSTPFTLEDLQEKKVMYASDTVVMQYTGLKDKNGKEIYEGDIIHTRFGNRVIFWDKERASFCYTQPVLSETGESNFLLFNLSDPQVIGNQYETPHLI